MPASNALAYRNGLKFEPGWRFAWVARLNLDSSKPMPPTRARMAPCLGSNDTSADCALGTCASRHPSPSRGRESDHPGPTVRLAFSRAEPFGLPIGTVALSQGLPPTLGQSHA